MPTVDRESVKVLAQSIGVRESARQLGLNENTVRQWSRRFQWFKRPIEPTTIQQRNGVTSVTKTPSQAYDAHLKAQKGKTKSNLARFLVNASKVAARSRSPLQDAPLVDKVASVYSKVHPEEKESTNQFNLQMVCSQAVVQVNQD